MCVMRHAKPIAESPPIANGLGAPVAYHIRRAYQSDWYEAAESMIWDRVPRKTAWTADGSAQLRP
jgi:hypothetical protein